MSRRLFRTETLQATEHLLDPGKAADIKDHQLLQNPDIGIVSPEGILNLGERLLEEIELFETGSVFSEKQQIPQRALNSLLQRGNQPFLARFCLGPTAEDWYLATGRVSAGTKPGQNTVELQIMPVSLQNFERSRFERHSEQTQLLSAAALTASSLPASLQAGLETTECSTKKSVVNKVTPDHSAPLAVAFDAFRGQAQTLRVLERATGNLALNLGELTHLHGVSANVAAESRQKASTSGFAGGLDLMTLRLDQVNWPYDLYVRHWVNEQGRKEIMTLPEMMPEATDTELFAQTAAALAFTAHVIDQTPRERTVEQLFERRNAYTPIGNLLRTLR